MEEYVKVDVLHYVSEGIKTGTLVPRAAEKFARIIAIQGQVGEEVISWSVDGQGQEMKEKVATVEVDEKTKEPGWIATKVDENGEIIIDENGHPNQWIIADSTFKKKYELDPGNPSMFRPTGGVQLFVQIPDNIILNQWGRDMQIAAGGYINITNPNDMYGISRRDFEDTYRFVDNASKPKTK